MKVSLGWLSQYCDIKDILMKDGPTKVAHTYSIQTAEIDDVILFGQEDKVLVGKVLSTAPHPDSDHLNIVQVFLGADIGEKQIVCGAENVTGAKYVAVATPGAILGKDFEIKVSKIRGVESNGMICSDDELGLADERAAGILELEKLFDASVLESHLGKPFYDLEVTIPGVGVDAAKIALKDVIFEIDNKFITNRPDLFSVRGNAREMSAIYDRQLLTHSLDQPLVGTALQVKVETPLVYAYHIVRLDNVSASAPHFGMKTLLQKSGLVSKFDLVDITNLVLTEIGQPMHVFDADKISGTLTVRMARDGEEMLALNGETYKLTSSDIVIADDREVLAIAGVIGGMSSAVSADTRNICFESANFDPVSVRLTSGRIGLRTDSSMRFEKSLDPLLALEGMNRALEMLAFLGKKGQNQSYFSHLDAAKINHISIDLSLDFIATKLGKRIEKEMALGILAKLGFETSFSGDSFTVKVPSWRATKDVAIKEDIAEEIGRIYGYDNIEEKALVGDISIAASNASLSFKNQIVDYFCSKKLYEAYNYSFSSLELDAKAGITGDADAVAVLNAWSKDLTHMRRSLIPHLLENASENVKSYSDFAFFELGKIFSKKGPSDFEESVALSGVFSSASLSDVQSILSGFISSVLPKVKSELVQDKSDKPYLHPGKSGAFLVYGNKKLITFGYLHPQVAAAFDLSDENTILFEIDYSLLVEVASKSDYRFAELPKFPGVSRELNFVFAKNLPVGEVAKKISKINNFISNVSVVDIYEDDQKIGQNLRSVTFSFELRDPTKTITDGEALVIQEKIISTLSKDGILLRAN